MTRFRPTLTAVLIFLAGAFTFGAMTARVYATGSVQTGAHLEVHPAPPYVRTSWTASPSTAQVVLESTWIARVNCTTGAPIAILGLTQLYDSGNAGPRTMLSRDVQVLPGDCLIPAGNITRNGAVLASSVGPLYRF